MKAALDKLSVWLSGIASVAVCVMMLAMTGDAVSRKIVGSIPGAYNTSAALLVIVMFLPLAYAQMRRTHVSIDLLTNRLSPRTQAILAGISAIIGIFVCGLLTWGSWQKAWDTTLTKEVWTGIIDYPAWPFRWFIPLGAGVFTLQLVYTAIDEFRKLTRSK